MTQWPTRQYQVPVYVFSDGKKTELLGGDAAAWRRAQMILDMVGAKKVNCHDAG